MPVEKEKPEAFFAIFFYKTMKRYFSSLRHRDFRLFWSGQVVSVTGTWLQNTAQGWLVLQITNSPFLLGITNGIAALPILLFSIIGGAVSDRINKRKMIIFTQTGQMLLAFTLGILISTKVIAFWQIAIIVAMVGLFNAFDMPARHSFVIEIVGKDDLSNAIAVNSLIFNVARIVGPVVAGFIVGILNISACFYLNGISFLAVIIGLLMMQGEYKALNNAKESVRRSTLEGAKYVWRSPPIRRLIILVAMSGLFGISYMVLMPVFARDILMVGPKGLGILLAAIGVGAIIGSFTLTIFSHSQKINRFIAIGGITLGINLIIFSMSHNIYISLLTLIGIGWGLITQTATINNFLQRNTPDELRGRVMGFYTFMLLGMVPLGSFQAGLIAHWFSVPISVGIGGVMCILMTAVFSRRFFDAQNEV